MSATMELPATKRCTKCGEVKDFGNFAMKKGGRHGLGAECRNCTKERNARYCAENADKEKERNARYRADNREKEKERNARYYTNNTVKVREHCARYRANNKEKVRGISALYRARQKAMREFFKMHRAMHAITETLNQMKP